jgi:hypothetical protein
VFARRLVSKALNGGRRHPTAGSQRNSHRDDVRGGRGNASKLANPAGGNDALTAGAPSRPTLSFGADKTSGASAPVSQRVALGALAGVDRLNGTISALGGCQKRGVTRPHTNHPETKASKTLILVMVNVGRFRGFIEHFRRRSSS